MEVDIVEDEGDEIKRDLAPVCPWLEQPRTISRRLGLPLTVIKLHSTIQIMLGETCIPGMLEMYAMFK
jgi:hypothetical protein